MKYIIQILEQKNILYINQVLKINPRDLCFNTRITLFEMLEFLTKLRMRLKNNFSLLKLKSIVRTNVRKGKIKNSFTIVTHHKDLDKLLGGGIRLQEITEISGLSGTGKTQFCIQLACNVTLPYWLEGLDGDCVYIDTEVNLKKTRLLEIAKGLVDHIKKKSKNKIKSKLLSLYTEV